MVHSSCFTIIIAVHSFLRVVNCAICCQKKRVLCTLNGASAFANLGAPIPIHTTNITSAISIMRLARGCVRWARPILNGCATVPASGTG